MAKTYSYEQLAPEYKQLWDTMRITRDAAVLHSTAEKIKQHKSVYEDIQKETGVPWQLVAVIHIREAGLGDVGKWKGVLHNGEKIVGTGRKTSIVPANRGPFSTWRAAAIDALKLKGFNKIKDWPVERMLWALEPYNGYGYRYKGLRSPYLWASTNHQQRGKYIRDHVFDPNVMDSQIGAAALLKYLGIGKSSVPVVLPTVAATGGLVAWFADHWPWIVIGGAAIIISWTIYKAIKEANAQKLKTKVK